MIHENKSMVPSQECVEQTTKIQPIILQPKDRQKIGVIKKIQDTNDIVEEQDTRGIANEDILQLAKKVRWKDLIMNE